jgi:hypothetical protein
MDYLLLCLCLILLFYVYSLEEMDMGSAADLAKLVENMKRASAITDRAATDAQKHAAIMDSFEQRMNLNHENMSKIEEYDKLMAAMDMGDNGGPALATTFQSSTEGVASATTGSTAAPAQGKSTVGMFNH